MSRALTVSRVRVRSQDQAAYLAAVRELAALAERHGWHLWVFRHPTERELFIHGGDEADYVDSGLEETMITAYYEVMDAYRQNRKVKDLRTAAFLVSINKIGTSYRELGIFP